MADKGAEGTGGRQVSRMQSGERGERVAEKEKKTQLNSTQSPPFGEKKSILICSRQNQKGRQKVQDGKYTYISQEGIYV